MTDSTWHEITYHTLAGNKGMGDGGQAITVAEVTAGPVLAGPQDVLDLFGELYGEQPTAVILHAAQLPPEFFQLRTRLAGEVLQKFVNYQLKVAVVGDFSQYDSQALRDFIYECNQGRQIAFTATTAEALARLAPAR